MNNGVVQELKSLVNYQEQLINLLESDVENYKKNNTEAIFANQQSISTTLTSISQLSTSLFQSDTSIADKLEYEPSNIAQHADNLMKSVRDNATKIVKQLSINAKITQSNLLDLKLIWDQLTNLASDKNCTYNKNADFE